MEKFSSFNQVVGNIPESEKEKILQEKGEVFDNQSFESLKGKERDKTPEEMHIIYLANEATDAIRKKYGLESFDIPQKNIHIIAEKKWPKDKRSSAVYVPMVQGIAVREQPGKMVFMAKVLHEMLHFKSFNSLQITSNENSELKEYRTGLTMITRNGQKMYFSNLNEAITEEITKQIVKELSAHPMFSEEIKKTRDVIMKHPKATDDSSGQSLFNEDTFYAETQNKKSWKEAIGRLFGAMKDSKNIIAFEFTYKQERKILNTLLEKIFKKNPKKFQNKDTIFETFAKSMMTGNLLPIGRLIDGTFGKGTMRRIGELDGNIEAQEEFVNTL